MLLFFLWAGSQGVDISKPSFFFWQQLSAASRKATLKLQARKKKSSEGTVEFSMCTASMFCFGLLYKHYSSHLPAWVWVPLQLDIETGKSQRVTYATHTWGIEPADPTIALSRPGEEHGLYQNLAALWSMTKVLDGGRDSVSYHSSCQGSSKKVQRGVRLHLDVSSWCKQNGGSTWRLAHCRRFAVSSDGRSDRWNLPVDDKFLFFSQMPFVGFNKIQQATAESANSGTLGGRIWFGRKKLTMCTA